MTNRHSRPAAPSPEAIAAFVAAVPKGKANAVTFRVLARQLGLRSAHADRQLRNLAQHAADLGYLVCSGNDGYYIPASITEAEEAIRRWRSQAALMDKRARTMQALAERYFYGQGRLMQ